MKLGIEGFHAIVTGGTRGIGKAIVEGLLREGCNVSYCARNVTGKEFADFNEKEQGISSKAQAVGVPLDLTHKDEIEPWIKNAVEKFGRLDILISNGSPMAAGPTVEDWTISFKADILGCVLFIQHSVPYLEKSPMPSIIVNGSAAGRERVIFAGSGGREAPYGPFKAALAQHVNNMTAVLGPKNIRINCITPGLIKFPGADWDKACQMIPDEVEPFIQRVTLGHRRWGTPEEVADTAVYLASPRAAYVHGATVLITGGFHIATAF